MHFRIFRVISGPLPTRGQQSRTQRCDSQVGLQSLPNVLGDGTTPGCEPLGLMVAVRDEFEMHCGDKTDSILQ